MFILRKKYKRHWPKGNGIQSSPNLLLLYWQGSTEIVFKIFIVHYLKSTNLKGLQTSNKEETTDQVVLKCQRFCGQTL